MWDLDEERWKHIVYIYENSWIKHSSYPSININSSVWL
jgi:hypothetical protein